MCKERKRTRDLLLEYNSKILPLRPRAAGLSIIYPWENMNLSMLSHQIFLIAKNNGYKGDEDLLWSHFSQDNIIIEDFNNFPRVGKDYALYLDKNSEILYYFKKSQIITPENAGLIGARIVGEDINNDKIEYCVYIPIRGSLIENSTLDAGTSTILIED